jgi:TetR/AcrR family transcriptional regulator, regulator of cefoperazone and chloramphenicol sensitivity
MNSISHTPQARLPESGELRPNAHYRRTRDRAGKQEALVQAALGLFATKGYEATTTREIAASARCAEGLIHRYFKGKAGLLTALIERHFSKEIVDLNRQLQPGHDLEAEFLQLVLWEVERFWETRDFLKVFIPRAFVDPNVAGVLKRAVISVRAKVIVERLRRYPGCFKLPREKLEALAQAVGMLGLVFGFMRPLVLGQDRFRAKQMAGTVAKMLVRSVNFAGANRSS